MFASMFSRLAVMVLAVLLATPALASAAEEGAKKTDMLAPDLVNSGVTLIVFLCLLAILYKFAWGPILAGLKAREDAEREKVEEANRARDEAAALRGQLQTELAKAADQVRAMIEEARRDAEKLRASEREVGVREAVAERERAKQEIQAAKDSALAELYQQAVDLATTLSAKTLARQISPDDHRRLLDESLAELKQTAKTSA